MPELPEVETTRAGIAPHLHGKQIRDVVVRHGQLRWPIPRGLKNKLTGHRIKSVDRRGKYILIRTDAGTLIMHLGMSGSLRIVCPDVAVKKHDHFDLVLDSGRILRLHDPRRFGAVLFTRDDPLQHKLLASLGPEPLEKSFTGQYLFDRSRKRNVTIKQFIMDSKIVVGVGNIYASESLFLAGINPVSKAGNISREKYQQLARAIKQVLRSAIRQGGTTLRDFTRSDGQPGYFAQKLKVYGREGEPCQKCGHRIRSVNLGQRSTYFCPYCQK